MDDGKLEVVGVTDVVHLANALGGVSNGVRLCQVLVNQKKQISTVTGRYIPLHTASARERRLP